MDDNDQKWKNHSNAVRLSTNSFTKQECILLKEALGNTYSLKVSLQKAEITKSGRQQYRLYISSKSFTTLKDIILPKLFPSMLYKFPGAQ